MEAWTLFCKRASVTAGNEAAAFALNLNVVVGLREAERPSKFKGI